MTRTILIKHSVEYPTMYSTRVKYIVIALVSASYHGAENLVS
jgi:hypothetical protein